MFHIFKMPKSLYLGFLFVFQVIAQKQRCICFLKKSTSVNFEYQISAFTNKSFVSNSSVPLHMAYHKCIAAGCFTNWNLDSINSSGESFLSSVWASSLLHTLNMALAQLLKAPSIRNYKTVVIKLM